MREELLGPKVENVGVAIVQDLNKLKQIEYNVYLLNLKEEIIEGIIITSIGYGVNANTGEEVKTSMLRKSLEVMMPNEAAKIEPIMEELFGLSNEYWVSFWINDVMYDKKYIFLPETVTAQNLKNIPVLGRKGVMII